jgi:hypothetical protein
MGLTALDDGYPTTRDELQRVAVHVLARALHAATGRIGLRPAPGGFATPEFGPERRRLRLSGGLLVDESGGSPTVTRAVEIDGSSLADLASFADVDLAVVDFSAGDDTPPVGDADRPLHVQPRSVAALAEWYDVAARALDGVVVTRSPVATTSSPTLAQLWPEHFDVGLDLAFDDAAPAERRVNLGGSPGDGFHADPYLYVGPWTDDRPGHPEAWNAPFGAVLGHADLAIADDPVAAATAFFRAGLERLTA